MSMMDSVQNRRAAFHTHSICLFGLSVIMRTALNTHKVNDFPFHWIEKCCSLPNSGEMTENAKGWIAFPVHVIW